MKRPEKSPKQPAIPGKRRPGERGKVKHGGFSYLITGQLPKDRAYLKPYLIATREALIHDHAAREEDLPAAKRILIDQVITNLGAVRLIQEYVRECGVFQHASALLQPALSTHYLSWLNRISKDLALLGIERRPRPEEALDAMAYIRTFDRDAELEKQAGPKKPKARRTFTAGRGTAQPEAARAALEAHVEVQGPGQATAAADAAAVPEDDQDRGRDPGEGDA